MWRDPMDELIDDLEQVAPGDPHGSVVPFAEFVQIVDTLLYGTEETKARLHLDALQASLAPGPDRQG